mgnify:CR=1 FL=1
MSVRLATVFSLLVLAACGGEPADGNAPVASKPPKSSGDVLSLDPASPPDAQVVAFLYGVHRFVLDDDEIYTASTRLPADDAADAVAAARLSDALTVRIEQQGDQQVLVFSNGPRGPLRAYTAPEVKP